MPAPEQLHCGSWLNKLRDANDQTEVRSHLGAVEGDLTLRPVARRPLSSRTCEEPDRLCRRAGTARREFVLRDLKSDLLGYDRSVTTSGFSTTARGILNPFVREAGFSHSPLPATRRDPRESGLWRRSQEIR